jgi:DNA-binding Lrp family transcriptional regulator
VFARKLQRRDIVARGSQERGELRKRLLELLQRNCSRPNKDLAFELKVDASNLSRLKDRMEKEGYIKDYKAILNPEVFGLNTLAYVKIALERPTEDASTVEFLKEQPEIQEIHDIQGPFDMILKVRVHTNADVMEFIHTKLTQEHNIKDTETVLTMGTRKETTDIPV